MTKLLGVLIILISSSLYSLEIEDNRTVVKSHYAAISILGMNPEIPKQITSNLDFNNSNGRVSPGELVLIKHTQLNTFHMPCYVEYKTAEVATWIRQDTYADIIDFDKESCLSFASDPDFKRECFISLINLQASNRAYIAANKHIAPGTKFLCLSPFERFEFEVID